jgi:hypothetical protein
MSSPIPSAIAGTAVLYSSIRSTSVASPFQFPVTPRICRASPALPLALPSRSCSLSYALLCCVQKRRKKMRENEEDEKEGKKKKMRREESNARKKREN